MLDKPLLSEAEVTKLERLGLGHDPHVQRERERHKQRRRHQQSLRESVSGGIETPDDLSYNELRSRLLGRLDFGYEEDPVTGRRRKRQRESRVIVRRRPPRIFESTTEPAERQRLQERTLGVPGKIDRESGVIHGVRVLGRRSRNNRVYSDKAMEQAVSLYEGQQVFIDHSTAERSLRDFFGQIESPRIEGTGEDRAVVGDLRFKRKHDLTESVLENAEAFPGSFGLSHDAEGLTRSEGGQTVVASLDMVHSVDLVTSPATNRSLFESSR